MEEFILNFYQAYRENNLFWVSLISFLYVVLLVEGPKFMASRSTPNLKIPLFLWNMFASLGSLAGFLILWQNLPLEGGLCSSTYVFRRIDMVVFICCLFSKYLEFIDTIFLILKKKEVIFLHWYHHLITAIHINFFLYVVKPSDCYIQGGHYSIIINLFVHFVMYFYYGLTGLGFRFPKPVGASVTSIQILQMFYMTYVAYIIYAYHSLEHNQVSVRFGLVMYLSYVFLFCHFFCQSYIFSKKKTVKKE